MRCPHGCRPARGLEDHGDQYYCPTCGDEWPKDLGPCEWPGCAKPAGCVVWAADLGCIGPDEYKAVCPEHEVA